MGLACAKLFCKKGAKVVVFGRRKSRLERAVYEIGENAIFFQGDIAQDKDVKELVSTSLKHLGRIDILDRVKSEVARKNWFIANSTHVADMAFLLGGFPKEMASFTAGGCDWHPDSAVFSGSGVSESGALFSYQANWLAPGRWSVEILTKFNRLTFRPLEKLQVQKHKSVTTEFIDIDDQLDIEFKPGFFRQTELFLEGASHNNFVSIEKYFNNVTRYFQKIGYPHRKK